MTTPQFKVDAGAAATVMLLDSLQQIFPGQASSTSDTHFHVYGDSTVESLQICNVFKSHCNKRF